MAFTDPQSVTISAVANSLPRVASGQDTGSFSKDDGLLKLDVAHSYGKRVRRTIRLTGRKIAADPFTTGLNVEYSMSAYIVIDVPKVGYSIAEQAAFVAGLTKYLTDSSAARVVQLLGGEN